MKKIRVLTLVFVASGCVGPTATEPDTPILAVSGYVTIDTNPAHGFATLLAPNDALPRFVRIVYGRSRRGSRYAMATGCTSWFRRSAERAAKSSPSTRRPGST